MSRRMRWAVGVAAAWALASAPTAMAAPPPNDGFTDAQIIVGPRGTVTGSNAGATHEVGEPDPYNDPGCCSVWFRWTAPASGTATIDTIGPGYATTLLQVLRGSSLGDLERIEGVGYSALFDYKSKLAFTAYEGTTYHFQVDAYAHVAGSFRLNWRLAPGYTTAVNDLFANAVTLTGAKGSIGGTTAGSTLEPQEPNDDGAPKQNSIWYRWTALSAGTASFSTYWSGAFDPRLDVFTGSRLTNLSLLAVGDDAGDETRMGRVRFPANSGSVYWIQVSSWNSEGAITLNWNLESGSAPANDALAAATMLSGSDGQVTGTTMMATKEEFERYRFHGGNNGWRSVWFTWTAPAGGHVSWDTVGSGFDTLISAYTGDSDFLYLIRPSDNVRDDMTSAIEFDVAAGQKIRIALDAYADDSGPYVLSWHLDTMLPDTVLDSGPSGVTTSWSASFAFHSVPAGLGFECSLDGSGFHPCTSPAEFTFLSDGLHRFEVRARNAAGVDPTPAAREWTVDTRGPETSITASPAYEQSSVTATFEFESPEAGAVFECALDAGVWASCTSPKTYSNLLPGWHVFEVRAVDAVGNQGPEAQRDWNVGLTLPSGALLLTGTAGADVITGTPGRDVLRGFGGDDVIRGLGGKDVFAGGAGRDRLYARDGVRDEVYGGRGYDRARVDRYLDRRYSVEALI
jgi:hypothetical protein